MFSMSEHIPDERILHIENVTKKELLENLIQTIIVQVSTTESIRQSRTSRDFAHI